MKKFWEMTFQSSQFLLEKHPKKQFLIFFFKKNIFLWSLWLTFFEELVEGYIVWKFQLSSSNSLENMAHWMSRTGAREYLKNSF